MLQEGHKNYWVLTLLLQNHIWKMTNITATLVAPCNGRAVAKYEIKSRADIELSQIVSIALSLGNQHFVTVKATAGWWLGISKDQLRE